MPTGPTSAARRACRCAGSKPGPGDEIVERRDICPLNEAGEPLEALTEDACWTLGPVEARLRRLQEATGAGAARRVPLRALFRRR